MSSGKGLVLRSADFVQGLDRVEAGSDEVPPSRMLGVLADTYFRVMALFKVEEEVVTKDVALVILGDKITNCIKLYEDAQHEHEMRSMLGASSLDLGNIKSKLQNISYHNYLNALGDLRRDSGFRQLCRKFGVGDDARRKSVRW